MKTQLVQVALRQQAMFVPTEKRTATYSGITQATSVFTANLARLGYTVSEALLHAVNELTPTTQNALLMELKTISGAHKNWTPLVKGWDIPTGETRLDHLKTFVATVAGKAGTRLQCGHIIPANSFPLERYNGCPFCGTAFSLEAGHFTGQASRLKVLEVWTETEISTFLTSLLTAKTALDATQVDSLKILLEVVPLPQVEIAMKETAMVVIETLVANGKASEAQSLFHTPQDVLRYLWYQHTGSLQIIEPKTIIRRNAKNNSHIARPLSRSKTGAVEAKAALKLKYNRQECRMIADWMNNLPVSVEKACETMHAKRRIWVRVIRAARLTEFARRNGYEQLKELLDVFYNQVYPVWQGEVNKARFAMEKEAMFELLKARPGAFARQLFANMLWFGERETTNAFAEVIDQVPMRLVLSLNMYAGYYFSESFRVVKPLGGTSKRIPAHPLVYGAHAKQLQSCIRAVEELTKEAVFKRFAGATATGKTMYIDEGLYNIPLAIGDRSETIHDIGAAQMGTRFPVEGNEIRLFMQWGTGLTAQHLDMDLSCQISYPGRIEHCSYSRLTATGCKHSGDMRYIPHKVGTAEYISIDLKTLEKSGAEYVTFTCNAYSHGAIAPNLVVGWMDSRYPMRVSESSGVAYDPSCVQHQVRVTQTLTKGLVFGVLDVKARVIIWLETTFQGQGIWALDTQAIRTAISKLEVKTTIGELLEIKAIAQGLTVIDRPEADENYTLQWARNTAEVTALFID